MAARKHAILSASSAHRWMNCNPSARLEQEFEDRETEAAAEGTAAHALCEHKLRRAMKMQSRKPTSQYDCDEMDAYRKHALFLFNDQTIKAVRKLKDGNGQFLWQPGLNGQPDTLLGYRYETSYHMPLIGAGAKPILFGDFSSYWIADREGRSIQRLNELYAATGQIGFRVTQRLDARLVQQEGMKCLAMKAGS